MDMVFFKIKTNDAFETVSNNYLDLCSMVIKYKQLVKLLSKSKSKDDLIKNNPLFSSNDDEIELEFNLANQQFKLTERHVNDVICQNVITKKDFDTITNNLLSTNKIISNCFELINSNLKIVNSINI